MTLTAIRNDLPSSLWPKISIFSSTDLVSIISHQNIVTCYAQWLSSSLRMWHATYLLWFSLEVHITYNWGNFLIWFTSIFRKRYIFFLDGKPYCVFNLLFSSLWSFLFLYYCAYCSPASLISHLIIDVLLILGVNLTDPSDFHLHTKPWLNSSWAWMKKRFLNILEEKKLYSFLFI